MIRILFFVLVILALGAGFAWLADRPGELSLIWEGTRVEMSLMVAATLLVSLIAAVLIAIWIFRTLWLSPQLISRYFRARKRDRGYQALSTGLIAAGAGDAAAARRMTARTRGLLSADQEPLIHLLEAQTALIEGKYDVARKKFEVMADDPETRDLGLRGLYLEARRLGSHEAALHFAERASKSSPHLPWATMATLEHHGRSRQWDEAIKLIDHSRAAHVIEKPEAGRKKAVFLAARATDRLEADPKGARDDALAALKLDETLVPAALVAAKALIREDNLRKASHVLERIWKREPHPDVARAYVRARSGDSALDRLKRAHKLEALRPNNAVSLAAVAEAALDARELRLAREKAEASARLAPRESAFLLLADIEEADTGDDGRIRHWMNQALKSPRDPAWTADGIVSAEWLPVSPVTGRLDAFEWKTPVGQIEGPLEDGGVNVVEQAIRSLPPVSSAPMAPVATPAPAPVAAVAQPVAPFPLQEPALATVPAAPAQAKAEPVAEEPSTALVATVAAEPASVPRKTEPASAVKPANVERNADQGNVVEPFFGRPPDDPGVRDGSKTGKTTFRLF